MQHFRSGLTRLKTLMEQRLPEGEDIYGYQGVSRDSLLDAINVAYSLSQEIKEHDESRFEVISLKRAGSELYKILKEFLDNEAEAPDASGKFNEFLNGFSALIEKTKITYLIVVKGGIRDEAELARIRSDIKEYEELKEELTAQKEAVVAEISTIYGEIESLKTNHSNSETYATEITGWHKSATDQIAKITEIHDSIEGWDEDVQESTVQFQALSKQISDLASTATTNNEKLAGYVAKGNTEADQLMKTVVAHQELLAEIRQTLDGANRVGMASSFDSRKTELAKQLNIWQFVFVGAIALIVVAVWKFILPTLSAENTHIPEILAELGIVSPLVWLGWFAAKQYGYTSKIKEDYAFKAAAAMAYEGHKKAARETDPDLESLLLEFSLFNMSQNPIRLYGNGDMHGTPLHEFTSQVLEKFPKFKKISASAPTVGSLEVSSQENKKEE